MPLIRAAEYFFINTIKFFADPHTPDIHGPGILYGLRNHAGAFLGLIPSFKKDVAAFILHPADDPVPGVQYLAADHADHWSGGKYIRQIIDFQDSRKPRRAYGGPDLAKAEIVFQSPLPGIDRLCRRISLPVNVAEYTGDVVDPGFGCAKHKVILRSVVILIAKTKSQKQRPSHKQNSGNIIRRVQIVNTKIRFEPGIRKMFPFQITFIFI